jgi:membrane associated rhomboid family serine protease
MIHADFKILIENIDKKKAEDLLLVLAANHIIGVKTQRFKTHMILVEKNDYHRALKQIRLYSSENRHSPTVIQTIPVQWFHFSGGLIASILLFIIHYKTSPEPCHTGMINRFGASAHGITHGEFYRGFTALLLHADWPHLFGNMAGMIIFGGFVTIAASGKQSAAFLMIIFSGISGNIFNAFFHRSFHLSIGASTSVFGAVGILAGINFIYYLNKKIPKATAFKPVAAGFALIAILGTGENADISGHLFGFFSGVTIGMVYIVAQMASDEQSGTLKN